MIMKDTASLFFSMKHRRGKEGEWGNALENLVKIFTLVLLLHTVYYLITSYRYVSRNPGIIALLPLAVLVPVGYGK